MRKHFSRPIGMVLRERPDECSSSGKVAQWRPSGEIKDIYGVIEVRKLGSEPKMSCYDEKKENRVLNPRCRVLR